MRTNAAAGHEPARVFSLDGAPKADKPWRVMVGDDERGNEGFVRLTLEVRESDAVLFSQLAELRNARARVEDKYLRKQWSRKMIAESACSAQASLLRNQLQEMVAACGPMPTIEGPADAVHAAFEKYARKVIAWDKRHG